MKRSMINRERLRFPSGTAAAVLLQSLYSEGAEALAKGARALWSGAVGVLVPLLTELDVVKASSAAGRAERDVDPALPSRRSSTGSRRCARTTRSRPWNV